MGAKCGYEVGSKEPDSEDNVSFSVNSVSQMIVYAAANATINRLREHVYQATSGVRDSYHTTMFGAVNDGVSAVVERLREAQMTLNAIKKDNVEEWLSTQPDWLRSAISLEIEAWVNTQFRPY